MNDEQKIATLTLALEEIVHSQDHKAALKLIAKTALLEASNWSHLNMRQPIMVTNSNQIDCPNVYKVTYFNGVSGQSGIVDIENHVYTTCLTLQEFADKFTWEGKP